MSEYENEEKFILDNLDRKKNEYSWDAGNGFYSKD